MIVRDSGSNIVKACNDMKAPHIPCIGHMFHIILAPLCVEPKKSKIKLKDPPTNSNSTTAAVTTAETQQHNVETATGTTEEAVPQQNEHETMAIDGVDLFGDDPNEFTINESLLEIRSVVSKVQMICCFVKNSTLSKGILNNLHKRNHELYFELILLIEQDNLTTRDNDDIQVETDDMDAQLDCFEFYGKHGDGDLRKKVKKFILDVQTRWNSAYAMIQRFLQQCVLVNQYMEWYYRPTTQKNHFANTKNKLKKITGRDWAILMGVAYLLEPFALATDQLSADRSSTICGVAPAINYLGNSLKQETLLNKPSNPNPRNGQSKFKHELYAEHEGTEYFEDVIQLLKKCQEYMRDKYVGKFKQYLCNAYGIWGKLAWLTLLHPKEFSQWLW
jgi:hypothetical protein